MFFYVSFFLSLRHARFQVNDELGKHCVGMKNCSIVSTENIVNFGKWVSILSSKANFNVKENTAREYCHRSRQVKVCNLKYSVMVTKF